MSLYKVKYNTKKNGDINLDHPIRFVYSDDKELKYEDPVLIWSSLSFNEILICLNKAIKKEAYIKEYKSIIFGPVEPGYDDDGINAEDVAVYYVDTKYIIHRIEFYKLCMLVCEAISQIMKSFNFINNEIINKEVTEEILALYHRFKEEK